jgi:hypothetical protein
MANSMRLQMKRIAPGTSETSLSVMRFQQQTIETIHNQSVDLAAICLDGLGSVLVVCRRAEGS